MNDDFDAVFVGSKVVVIAAHPDDEVIGCSALMAWFGRGCTVVHVTDGVPRDLSLAKVGFPTPDAYGQARRREAIAAAAVAGIGEEQLLTLGIVDKEASLHLAPLSRRLRETLRVLRPDLVITHSYEGGHPDHDAAAFAARAAVDALGRAGEHEPVLMEFTSYHSAKGIFQALEFLPGYEEPIFTIPLDPHEIRRKRQMFDCYRTQHRMLGKFRIAYERHRRAPRYDFTRPPHRGVVWYETFPSGMTAARWVTLAQAALDDLARDDMPERLA